MRSAVICVAGFICGFAIGWIVNGWRLSADIAIEKSEVVQSGADHFRDVTQKVNDRASEYAGNAARLEKRIAELKKELADAKKRNPVPDNCRPDPLRLRVLKDAVDAANRAAGQESGGGVQTVAGTAGRGLRRTGELDGGGDRDVRRLCGAA